MQKEILIPIQNRIPILNFKSMILIENRNPLIKLIIGIFYKDIKKFLVKVVETSCRQFTRATIRLVKT